MPLLHVHVLGRKQLSRLFEVDLNLDPIRQPTVYPFLLEYAEAVDMPWESLTFQHAGSDFMPYETVFDLYQNFGALVLLTCLDSTDRNLIEIGDAIRQNFGFEKKGLDEVYHHHVALAEEKGGGLPQSWFFQLFHSIAKVLRSRGIQ